ncbi:MAG TPA: UV DNA damage repair endonuclease UvsE [Desulfobacteraceae bacterium]|nr:UV DNA damage repair endonuclease UvsE [Desulfobacteraceae bacterium]
MIRLGLCCIFKSQDIRFRRTTAGHLAKFPRDEQLQRLSEICLANTQSLMQSLVFCRDNGIGDFRINSQILPLKTHPDAGYDLEDLPEGKTIISLFEDCGRFGRRHDIRTGFHPDQFIVLSSPDPGVVARSVADLAYQAQVAQWVGADVINIHGGGVYGDKPAALKRLSAAIGSLPENVRTRLTLENDDRSYTPEDLLPVCRDTGVPLVYDVHHHRCLPDGLDIAAATRAALTTWNREPLFHLSSPKEGWKGKNPKKHHDLIDPDDFPDTWKNLDITVEVEAKDKELAVAGLSTALQTRGIALRLPMP